MTCNYRPVSLTSVVCKLMESLIRDALMKHMVINNFRSQLLTVQEAWTTILDEEASLDAFYLDFQKAFDTVPHKRLLIKSRSYGVNGNVIRWIADVLSDRRQLVTVNGEKSGWAPVAYHRAVCWA